MNVQPFQGAVGSTSRAVGVLGSANLDLVVRVAARPRPGETVFGQSFLTNPGGKGLNQAVAAARAGAHVHFVGCVGTDRFGDELVALLDAEGISRRGLRRVSDATGTAHITVEEQGENSIIVVSGANLATRAEQLGDDLLGDLGWLVTQLELPLSTVDAALTRARASGVRSVLTPAPVRPLTADVLGKVDVLVPNQLEACALAGVDDAQRAAARLSEACGDVVVTLGDKGALWARGGQVVAQVAARQVPVVDTTGAGDTFVGYLVAALAEGRGEAEALELANEAASIAVGRPGATSAMPRRAELAGTR